MNWRRDGVAEVGRRFVLNDALDQRFAPADEGPHEVASVRKPRDERGPQPLQEPSDVTGQVQGGVVLRKRVLSWTPLAREVAGET